MTAAQTILEEIFQPYVKEMLGNLREGAPTILLGPRRSKKTFVIDQFLEAIKNRRYQVIHLPMDSPNLYAALSLSDFFHRLVEKLIEQTKGTIEELYDDLPDGGFQTELRRYADSTQRPLVVIIDHVENLPVDLINALFDNIRKIYEEVRVDPRGSFINFVISTALNTYRATISITSPLYNKARPVRVGGVSVKQSRRLIEAYLSADQIVIEQKDEVVNLLLEHTQGVADLIEVICKNCIEAAEKQSNTITTDLIKKQLDSYIKIILKPTQDYSPLREAVSQIERDADLLMSFELLLDQDLVPIQELMIPTDIPNFDPVYATGMVNRINDDSYQIRNKIYHSYLRDRLSAFRITELLAWLGRVEDAFDRLKKIPAATENERRRFVAVLIHILYTPSEKDISAQFAIDALCHLYKWVEGAEFWIYQSGDDVMKRVGQSGTTTQKLSPNPVSINDDGLEARAFRSRRFLRGQEDTRWRYAFPLLEIQGEHQRAIAVIVVSMKDNTIGSDLPSREKISELTGFLRQLTHALSYVRSVELRRDVIRELFEPIQSKQRDNATSRLFTKKEMLNRVLKLIKRLIPYDKASIQLINDSGSPPSLVIEDGIGFDDLDELKKQQFSLDSEKQHPNVDVWRERKPKRLRNVQNRYPVMQDTVYQVQDMRSWMGIPLIQGDKCIGVITLDHHEENFFTSVDEFDGALFAHEAANALEVVRHSDTIEQEKLELQNFADSLEWLFVVQEKVGDAVVKAAAEALDFDSVVLYPINQEGQIDRSQWAQYGLLKPEAHQEEQPHLTLYGSLVEAVLKENALYIDDIEHLTDYQIRLLKLEPQYGFHGSPNLVGHPFIEMEKIRGLAGICLPDAQGKPIGILFLNSREKRTHSYNKDLIIKFAQLASAALQMRTLVSAIKVKPDIADDLKARFTNHDKFAEFLDRFQHSDKGDPEAARQMTEDVEAIFRQFMDENSKTAQYKYEFLHGRQGRSGAAVAFMRYWNKETRMERRPVVLKIDKLNSERRISTEIQNYLDFVDNYLQQKPILLKQEPFTSSNLEALVYTLEGEPLFEEGSVTIPDLKNVCRNAADMLPEMLERVFWVMRRWFETKPEDAEDKTIAELYIRQWELDSQRKIERMENHMNAIINQLEFKNQLEFTDNQIVFRHVSYPHPRVFVDRLSGDQLLRAPYLKITHGDLNPQNVILGGQTVYLIDFHRTGYSHEFSDFAKLETALRFEVLGREFFSVRRREALEHRLADVQKLDEEIVIEPNDSKPVRDLINAINFIRQYAERMCNSNDELESYFTGLLFNAIQSLTWAGESSDESNHLRQGHALLMAAIVGRKVEKLAEIRLNHRG